MSQSGLDYYVTGNVLVQKWNVLTAPSAHGPGALSARVAGRSLKQPVQRHGTSDADNRYQAALHDSGAGNRSTRCCVVWT